MKKIFITLGLCLVPALVLAKDGVFSGTGTGGKRGPVSVELTVKDSRISGIAVTQSKEDRRYAYGQYRAFDRLGQTIIANNNYNVDAVSGATMSSRAYLNAVADALGKAGLGVKLKGARLKPAP